MMMKWKNNRIMDTTTWKYSAFDRNSKACKEDVNPREAVVTLSSGKRRQMGGTTTRIRKDTLPCKRERYKINI
uniref:Uncharacterized protein n=1 Tax=Strongyloides venezuelensis TaxID=75913 RepID=A0A0K0FRB2_STRVS